MAKYLRDEYLKNLKIDSKALVQLNELFTERCEEINSAIPKSNMDNNSLSLVYIIRFDNKGYKLTDFDAFKNTTTKQVMLLEWYL